jgi:GT2 family glycosyltransferase
LHITAIVTAYQRIEQTLVTLEKIRACEPAPEEILVHVDCNQTQCKAAILGAFPDIKVVCSQASVGPGGGRNKLVAAAGHEIVASFDDDSYPIDADYFARVATLFEQFPAASVLCAAVYHQGEPIAPDSRTAEWVSDFIGCGCVYRRSAFLATMGYVPLTVAYGMEEVDLALRLHAQRGKILSTSWLRVFHNTDLKRHADPQVTAGSIANLALLAYLRYPPLLWIVGLGQFCNRIVWLLRNGRQRGILSGLLMIPQRLRSNRQYRQRMGASVVRSYLALRRTPIAANFD